MEKLKTNMWTTFKTAKPADNGRRRVLSKWLNKKTTIKFQTSLANKCSSVIFSERVIV